jgi:hypothetical protein
MSDYINEERKLMGEAAGLKGTGTPAIRGVLEGRARADGFTSGQVRALVTQVLSRLRKTETGVQGNSFAVPHAPQSSYNAITRNIQNIRK